MFAIHEFNIGDSTYNVRGLSVLEMSELAELGLLDSMSRSYTLWSKIARIGIVGWRNVFYKKNGERFAHQSETGYTYKQVPDTKEDGEFLHFEDLPIDEVVAAGQFIYYNLSLLTEEETNKYRGYTRFKYWFAGKKMRKQRETYDCEACVAAGHYKVRVCGKSPEQINLLLGKANESKPQVKVQPRKTRRGSRMSLAKPKPEEEREKRLLSIRDFQYPECPSSWIDLSIKMLTNKISWCSEKGVPFIQGGLAEQPNKLWEAMQLIQSEESVMQDILMEMQK